jgi:hypothetical protein
MTEYITQEQALAFAMKHGDVVAEKNGRKDFCFDDYGVRDICNAAIQAYIDSQPESYNMMSWNAGFAEAKRLDKNKELDRIARDSQPKPASVEEIMGLVVAHESAAINSDENPSGLLHSRTLIKNAITQQAQALAQALAQTI